MTTLRAEPFGLDFSDLVIAKIYVSNKIGRGPESALNTEGVHIQTEPIIPPTAPIVIYYDEYSVRLSIETLIGDQTGGSAILYYDLAWDEGSEGALWESYHS